MFQVKRTTSFVLSDELLLSLKKVLVIILEKPLDPMKAQTELKTGHRFGRLSKKSGNALRFSCNCKLHVKIYVELSKSHAKIFWGPQNLLKDRRF